MSTVLVRKAKWKPLELSLSRKIVNQNQYFVLGGMQRLVPQLRTWRMKGWWFPSHSHSTHIFGLYRKQTDLKEWRYIIIRLTKQWLQLQLLCQMWFRCLSKLTHFLVLAVYLLTWKMPFTPSLLISPTRRSLLSDGKASNTLSLSYLGYIVYRYMGFPVQGYIK